MKSQTKTQKHKQKKNTKKVTLILRLLAYLCLPPQFVGSLSRRGLRRQRRRLHTSIIRRIYAASCSFCKSNKYQITWIQKRDGNFAIDASSSQSISFIDTLISNTIYQIAERENPYLFNFSFLFVCLFILFNRIGHDTREQLHHHLWGQQRENYPPHKLITKLTYLTNTIKTKNNQLNSTETTRLIFLYNKYLNLLSALYTFCIYTYIIYIFDFYIN